MTLKLEINLTNKWIYSLISIFVILILGVGVWAYNSGRTPSILGHSGEEIEVTINGETKLLNQALNEIISSSGNSFIFGTNNCYMIKPDRWTSAVCKDGFYVKALYKYTDNNWDGYGAMCCYSDYSIDLGLPNYDELKSKCPWGWGRITCAEMTTTFPANI